ncbi:MAG: DUF1569 domain-containing protein [Bacteroidota bacterium]
MKRVSWVLSLLVILITLISISNNRENDPDFLDKQLLEVEKYFAQRDIQNATVSQANVAWHLDHTLKTINRITENLRASNPEKYSSKFNMQRIVVHTSGIIPRGAAQSPKSVRPPDTILLDSLRLQLAQARQNLSTISSLDENAFFAHPVFDHLDRDQTRRFLEIHTNHHLKIIKDILGQ